MLAVPSAEPRIEAGGLPTVLARGFSGEAGLAHGSAFQHGAGDGDEAVGDRPEGRDGGRGLGVYRARLVESCWVATRGQWYTALRSRGSAAWRMSTMRLLPERLVTGATPNRPPAACTPTAAAARSPTNKAAACRARKGSWRRLRRQPGLVLAQPGLGTGNDHAAHRRRLHGTQARHLIARGSGL